MGAAQTASTLASPMPVLHEGAATSSTTPQEIINAVSSASVHTRALNFWRETSARSSENNINSNLFLAWVALHPLSL